MVQTRTDQCRKRKYNIPLPLHQNFAFLFIIVTNRKDPSTHEVSYRMAVDFRMINGQLEYWSYPLMRIDGIFSKLDSPKLIPTSKVRSSYYNITVSEDGRKYTAFTTEYGKY